MELTKCREEIGEIDEQLIRLLARRMEIVSEVGRFKKENGLPVRDAAYEEEKIEKLSEMSDEKIRPFVPEFFRTIFQIAREYEEEILKQE